MLAPNYRKKFLKDLKLAEKRGKEIRKLKRAMRCIINEKPLGRLFRDHALKGEYTDCRECHIEPNWLLIYLIQDEKVTFIRTGTHADLFR
ncbi:MAG: type II toxin-antitoxin system YafQ family toxin [Pseudomonadota bacterium]